MNYLPTIATVDVPACPVCHGEERRNVAKGRDYEYETCANEWRFWRCNDCEHAWLDPRPSEHELSVIYPRNYYSYQYEDRVSPIALRGKAWLDRRKFQRLTESVERPFGSYLDIGCSTGRFLRLASELGADPAKIAGIELDSSLVEKLRSEGLVVECSRVEDSAVVRERSFDLITMFHVIEHVADPSLVIKQLGNSLAPGGVLAMETPNLDSLDARIFRSGYWGGYHIPRHWHIFTPASMARALTDAGLELVEIRYQPGHSFWLFSFHHVLKFGIKRLASFAPLVHPLRSLPALVTITAFDLLRSTLGMKTSAMLVIARKKGQIAQDS